MNKSVDTSELFWRRVSEDLAIDIVTPFEVVFPDNTRLRVSALVKDFGRLRGMLVVENYDEVAPHTKKIIESGFGYCAKVGGLPERYDRTSMIDVLRDWGWCGPEDQRPRWLA
jgi:hypothetical protein